MGTIIEYTNIEHKMSYNLCLDELCSFYPWLVKELFFSRNREMARQCCCILLKFGEKLTMHQYPLCPCMRFCFRYSCTASHCYVDPPSKPMVRKPPIQTSNSAVNFKCSSIIQVQRPSHITPNYKIFFLSFLLPSTKNMTAL